MKQGGSKMYHKDHTRMRTVIMMIMEMNIVIHTPNGMIISYVMPI